MSIAPTAKKQNEPFNSNLIQGFLKTKSKNQVLKDASARNKMDGQKQKGGIDMKKIVVTQEMMKKQDGKRAGGYSKHWLYLTNLRAYREGVLLGVYLHFPFDEKDLEEAYKMIYVGNEFIDDNGESYEEYFITDYDAPFSISEYDFPQKLAEKYDNLRGYMCYPEEVVRYIADCSGKAVNIINLGASDNLTDHEKMGHSLIVLGYYEVPCNLLAYIDYEKLGKDFLINVDGDIVGNYFIEFI